MKPNRNSHHERCPQFFKRFLSLCVLTIRNAAHLERLPWNYKCICTSHSSLHFQTQLHRQFYCNTEQTQTHLQPALECQQGKWHQLDHSRDRVRWKFHHQDVQWSSWFKPSGDLYLPGL